MLFEKSSQGGTNFLQLLLSNSRGISYLLANILHGKNITQTQYLRYTHIANTDFAYTALQIDIHQIFLTTIHLQMLMTQSFNIYIYNEILLL